MASTDKIDDECLSELIMQVDLSLNLFQPCHQFRPYKVRVSLSVSILRCISSSTSPLTPHLSCH